MVVPRPLIFPDRCAAPVVFLERTFGPHAQPVDRPVFPWLPACPDGAPALGVRPYFNASLDRFGRFRPVFQLPGGRPKSGQADPIPVAAYVRTERLFWNPFGTTGGTPTHSRRTGLKLEQLVGARQALVRVPESNTKYGGNPGKPEGRATPSVPPSIGESSQIRQAKKLFARGHFSLRPAVHSRTIYCRRGLASARLKGAGLTCRSIHGPA